MVDILIPNSRKDITIMQESLCEQDMDAWIENAEIISSLDWLMDGYQAVKNNKHLAPFLLHDFKSQYVHEVIAILNQVYYQDMDGFQQASD